MTTPGADAEREAPAPGPATPRSPDGERDEVDVQVVTRASRHAAEAFYLAVRRLAREHGLEVSGHEVHNPIPGAPEDGPG